MPQKLTLTKVVLKNFSRNAVGGSASLIAALTAPVRNAMDWGEFQDWEESAKPAGRLATSSIQFTPVTANNIGTEKSISNFEKLAFQLDGAGAVRDFEIIRTQIKKGKNAKKVKKTLVQLKFTIDYTDSSGARKMEPYIQLITESTLLVTYEKEAEQEELELDGDRAKATGKEAD